MNLRNIDIFHIHTYRCGHAANYSDEEYVQKAIQLGAKSIAFTDHAPFPNNPFRGRMNIEQLPEYISSLKNLRKKYADKINIIIGLEIEYFEKYDKYYRELKNNPEIDILILGQHMYQVGDNSYSFNLSKNELNEIEYIGLGKSVIKGIKTNFFDVVAHPDRIYRRRNCFGNEERKIAEEIINTAIKYDISLEINKESLDAGLYVKEFWDIVKKKEAEIIYGVDAHSPTEIERYKNLKIEEN